MWKRFLVMSIVLAESGLPPATDRVGLDRPPSPASSVIVGGFDIRYLARNQDHKRMSKSKLTRPIIASGLCSNIRKKSR